MNRQHYHALSENAIMIDFGKQLSIEKNARILTLAEQIANNPFLGFVESVPSYTTLTVYYNPINFHQDSFKQVCLLLDTYLTEMEENNYQSRIVTIPVCYDESFGFDLEEVASHNNLSTEQVINLHQTNEYHVFFLGFTPGFPFLGGMDARIAAPRKKIPRTNIPAGSVGIAGQQTGIYPIASPGGWQIIGRTPMSLLQIKQQPPTMLKPGDKIKFQSISKQAFLNFTSS
ncbi:5-oxoprolinase subunit PxpB [Aquibacillus saliphilus]|uniref:5-oxoprolinase subunit PxpB n=1 Tax=Aquibacillus saliphilus TaxID=1909422 RepID=UPI001CF056BB|nr:5-oxoprolinase subunit PxpB [Aquibacillus saliphilus]